MRYTIFLLFIFSYGFSFSQENVLDKNRKGEVVLYPNPVLKDAYAILSIKTPKEYVIKTVEVFNVLGIKETSAYTSGKLDVSTLNKGVYIVSCNGYREGRRLLVIRKLIVK